MKCGFRSLRATGAAKGQNVRSSAQPTRCPCLIGSGLSAGLSNMVQFPAGSADSSKINDDKY